MSDYKQSIFYDIQGNVTSDIWEGICRDAKSKSYYWWVDKLPGTTRERIEMSFDEILKYLHTDKIHFSIVHRRGFDHWNKAGDFNQWHLEIGFCTMTRNHKDGDLFLWINLDEKHIPYFIKTYKLEVL